jgi:hypothetical protein
MALTYVCLLGVRSKPSNASSLLDRLDPTLMVSKPPGEKGEGQTFTYNTHIQSPFEKFMHSLVVLPFLVTPEVNTGC